MWQSLTEWVDPSSRDVYGGRPHSWKGMTQRGIETGSGTGSGSGSNGKLGTERSQGQLGQERYIFDLIHGQFLYCYDLVIIP
jgi:hypothetical protein